MFQAGSRQGIEAKLVEIGGAAGLSQETVLACIADPSGAERMTRLGELATRDQVTGTPTFFLNGELMSPQGFANSTGGYDYAKFAALIDAAIAAHAGGG